MSHAEYVAATKTISLSIISVTYKTLSEADNIVL